MLETTIAIERLIMSGLLDRHPDLRIVIVHSGGYVAYQAGRLRHARTVRTYDESAPQDPADYFGQIKFDCLTHDRQALEFLLARVGTDNVVMGTDLPCDMATPDPWNELVAVAGRGRRPAGGGDEHRRPLRGAGARGLSAVPAMPNPTTAEAVVARLEAHGVRHVFGIPGTHNLPLYRHLAASSIEHVLPRHEQGAGYAADGYARSGGGPGVCLATSGPGVLNLASAVGTAHADSVPMLVLAPGMATSVAGGDTGYLHEARDQTAAMAGVAASAVRVEDPAAAAAAIDMAFDLFRSGRPRPAYVEIPLDAMKATGEAPAPIEAGIAARQPRIRAGSPRPPGSFATREEPRSSSGAARRCGPPAFGLRAHCGLP